MKILGVLLFLSLCACSGESRVESSDGEPEQTVSSCDYELAPFLTENLESGEQFVEYRCAVCVRYAFCKLGSEFCPCEQYEVING